MVKEWDVTKHKFATLSPHFHMVTGECDTHHGTTSVTEPHVCNQRVITEDYREAGADSSQTNQHGYDPHLSTNIGERCCGVQTTMGQHGPRAIVQEAHQPQMSTMNANPQQANTTRDIPVNGNNPIDQLAHAIEKIAANKLPMTTPLLKPITASTIIFDGKNEKFELFEDLFHTMLKMQPEVTEAMKINHFHSLLRKEALQTFKNIQSTSRTTLEEILVIFRRKYVKPQSVATAKHKWHKLMFNPSEQSLPDFLEELHQTAERAFGEQAQSMIDSLLYAKMPPSLKKSINHAYLENGTYEQIIRHIEREMELNGLEQGDDLPVATMSATNQQTSSKPTDQRQSSDDESRKRRRCHYCKKEGHIREECYKLKRRLELEAKGELPPRPTCEYCHKIGHRANRCYHNPDRENKPKMMKMESDDSKEKVKEKETLQKGALKASTSKDLNLKRHDSNLTQQ